MKFLPWPMTNPLALLAPELSKNNTERKMFLPRLFLSATYTSSGGSWIKLFLFGLVKLFLFLFLFVPRPNCYCLVKILWFLRIVSRPRQPQTQFFERVGTGLKAWDPWTLHDIAVDVTPRLLSPARMPGNLPQVLLCADRLYLHSGSQPWRLKCDDTVSQKYWLVQIAQNETATGILMNSPNSLGDDLTKLSIV